MSTPNIIAICILVVAVGLIIGIKVYSAYKDKKKISVEQFVNDYGDQIIEVLKDAIVLLQIDQDEYESKEEYEKTIISYTIDMIKENYNEQGINIDIIDTSKLAGIVYDILQKNLVDIFSVLGSNVIMKRPELYEDEVIVALSEAE